MRQQDDGGAGSPERGDSRRAGQPGAVGGDGDRGAFIGWIQIAGVALVILIAAGLTVWLSARGGAPDTGPMERPDTPVRVTTPLTADHQVTIALTGTVAVTAFVDLTPQVSGRILSVSDSARAGAAFEAGEVLFRIDPRDYEVAVTRARSALSQARSNFAQVQAEAEVARDEWDRLYPGRPITLLAAREPQLEAARGQLLAAEADLDQAELNLERTTVSLPFSGRIVASRLEAGVLVSAGQAYGQAYDLDAVELVAPISPADLARLGAAEGAPVRLTLEAGGTDFPGRVVRIGARLDERTRFIDLFIAPEPGGFVLQPGLFADVLIEGPLLEDVMILPGAAVAGLDAVRLVRDGEIVSQRIDVLDRPRGRVIARAFDSHEGVIISPLPEGSVGRSAEIAERVEPPRAGAVQRPAEGPAENPAEHPGDDPGDDAADTGDAAPSGEEAGADAPDGARG